MKTATIRSLAHAFYEVVANDEEEILLADPLEMAFTFTLGEDSIRLLVGDDFAASVVDGTDGSRCGISDGCRSQVERR